MKFDQYNKNNDLYKGYKDFILILSKPDKYKRK